MPPGDQIGRQVGIQNPEIAGIEASPNNPGLVDLAVSEINCLERFAEYQSISDPDMPSAIDPISLVTGEYLRDVRIQRQKWPGLQINSPELEIYNSVIRSNTYNVFGARVRQSLLKLENWDALRTGHPDDSWLIQLVRFGFPLQYKGDPDPMGGKICENHASAKAYRKHVNNFIQNERDNRTILGPYKELPFQWASVAPMMTRPKSDPNKRRIIVDFSFPDGGINQHIDKNCVFGSFLEHRLPTVNHVVEIIRENNFDITMSTIDLERAYRNFRVDPADWPLTCITNQGQFYVDTAVPFGSRTSSLYMQKVACFIQRALLAKGIQIIVYLDDGIILTRPGSDPNKELSVVIQTIRSLGLPLAYDKIQVPSRRCKFLGIIIDLDQKCLEIPQEKLDSFLAIINDVQTRRFISKTMLQSIVGSVNHLAKAVQGARLFMNRFLHCLRQADSDRVPVCDQMLADIRWFQRFLLKFNGKSILNDGTPRVVIHADSSLIGGGATDGHVAYMLKYPPGFGVFSITHLEAINCLVALHALVGDRYNNQVVLVYCDNIASVHVFQNSKGHDKILNAVARAVWFFSAHRNIELRFAHKPGVEMTVPDLLSRAYISPSSRRRAFEMVKQNNLRLIDIPARFHDFNDYF